MMLRTGELVIGDSTPIDVVGGDVHGLIPRNFTTHPQGYCHPTYQALNLPVFPRSEWSDRIKEMAERKSRVSDYLLALQGAKALYQNGYGYCWAYSTGHAITALRAVMNLPYVLLSPFGVAQIIKNGRDEGGWGALSTEFAQANGYPSDRLWPNLKPGLSHDNAELRADMLLHKIEEGWVDLADPVYARNLSFDQMMTLLMCRIPVVVDFNWWGHSVCAVDPVEIEPGSFGPRILNSHGEVISEQLMVLQGSRGIPDGAVAPRVPTFSVN